MRRLGVLTPSSNTVLEPTIARLTAPLAGELSVHYARFPVTRVASDGVSDDQFAPSVMLEAARLLTDARVDLILWSGTSGAWLGIERDKALVAAIDQSLGVLASTATLGLLEAFGALRVARYGLVVPYLASVTEAIARNFGRLGFECTAKTCEGMSDNWQFATIDGATLADRVRTVARSRPDAVVIHCTNVGGAAVTEDLEAELGVPLLDSVVVGLWSALRGLGIDPPRAGFGRLATLPTAAPIAPGSRR